MAKTNVTPYGKQLRKLRIEREEGGDDMASRLDISSSYLSMIERGKRDIPDDFTDKIAETYGLTLEERFALIEAERAVK